MKHFLIITDFDYVIWIHSFVVTWHSNYVLPMLMMILVCIMLPTLVVFA